MSIINSINDVYDMIKLFSKANPYTKSPKYKSSSTKSGNNPKAIKARRKKNKNKKTHRK